MSLYYKIWVDCIVNLRSRPQNAGVWKFYAMVYTSFAMTVNVIVAMAILQRNILHRHFYELDLNIFPGTKLDGFIGFFALYFLPPVLLNYLLIFRGNRYKQLIPKYKDHKGRLFIKYFLGSLALPFVLLFLAYLWDKFTA